MKRKPNYKLKSAILNSDDMCKVVRDYDLLNGNTPFEKFIHTEEKYNQLLWSVGSRFIQEARKINLASWKRVQRLKDRIRCYLLKGQCIWLTLTFSEEVLKSTSVETRRKYVSRYLKSQSDYYLANIDFGKRNEREHYHAIVVSDFLYTEGWKDYGFTWTERIKNHIDCEKKLAKYVSKLTNHAIKETTKRQCYIYSRTKL